jgi:HTH-type transcriptional regulator / antitoxin HigA
MRTKTSKHAAADSYLQCVVQFPLKAIKTEREHDRAVDRIGRLMIRGKLDEGELQYVEALARLIGEYEDHAGHRMKVSNRDPIELLKFLMNESKMSVSALGKIIGSQGVASEVLSRRRELSKSHIRKLAEHFHVNPGLFL